MNRPLVEILGPLVWLLAAGPGPVSERALQRRARQAMEGGDFARCAELFHQASQVGSDRAPEHLYNSACCLVRTGDHPAAFARLEQAASLGFHELAQLRADPDLRPLRDDARWKTTVALVKARHAAYRRTVEPRLYRLFLEDQADRQRPRPAGTLRAADARRRRQVRALLERNAARRSDDYYHAAMIFQHGASLADFRMARELATKAVELDPNSSKARWLVAAATDRELVESGRPQRYGTQFTEVDGRTELAPVDPEVTDEERLQWQVPPLEEARRFADELNRRIEPAPARPAPDRPASSR